MFRSLLFLSVAGGSLLAGQSVAAAQTTPAPAPAPTQQTPGQARETIIPPIDFSLPPGEGQVQPTLPTVVPSATPTPAAPPRPSPTPTPTPTPTRQAAPAQQVAPVTTPAPVPSPAATSTPQAAPQATPTPAAEAESAPTASAPDPQAPPPVPDAGEAQIDWRWWLLAAGIAVVLAALLAVWWRRRRDALATLAETEVPRVPLKQPSPPPLKKSPTVPADAPQTAAALAASQAGYLTVPRPSATPAPAPQPAPRPQAPVADGTIRAFAPPPAPAGLVTAFRDIAAPMLDVDLRPIRAGITEEAAVLEFAFALRNPGPVAIGDALVSAYMLTANAAQDQQIAGYLAEEPDPSRHNLFALRPNESRELSAAMGLPFDLVNIVEAGDRRLLAPMLLIDARYRTPAGKAGRTFAAFMIGRPLESGKLQPVFTDRGPHMVDGVVAVPYPIRIARA